MTDAELIQRIDSVYHLLSEQIGNLHTQSELNLVSRAVKDAMLPSFYCTVPLRLRPTALYMFVHFNADRIAISFVGDNNEQLGSTINLPYES